MIRYISIVAASIALLTPTSVSAAEGCPYLSNAEVESATGRDLLFELTTSPMPDGTGTFCDSDIVRVIVLPGPNSEVRWDALMKGEGRDQEPRYPVTSMGEGAYALHLDPRADNEYPTALVVVASASFTLGLSVRAKDGEEAAAAEPQAVALAQLALTRIP